MALTECPHCTASIGTLNHEAADAHVVACLQIMCGQAGLLASVGPDAERLPELDPDDRPPPARSRRR